MFYKIRSATLIGINAYVIDIEVDLKNGLPQQTIVGLPDTAVREARERVNSAVRNSGFVFPIGKLTVNLAPANIRKEGSIFDLAIALGVLTVSSQIQIRQEMEKFIVLGECALDGRIRPIHGVLAIIEKARELGVKNIMLPAENFSEARLVSGLTIRPVKHLKDAVAVVTREDMEVDPALSCADACRDEALKRGATPALQQRTALDLSDVKGQSYAVRAVEIAAAGAHNLLLIGSPGSGKTMLASRIPGILPDMSEKESLETTKIYSVAGLLPPGEGLITERPFRAPHHTASEISIIGGGKNAIPGEITLSHNGILFLDEFPEFKATVIQSLRQPLESGSVTIARADLRLTYPSRFMLVASMNPCPCGYLFDNDKICRCGVSQVNKYYMKLSGPVLDRIDLQVEVKPLLPSEIVESSPSEPSSAIRERVVKARAIQQRRFERSNAFVNARMNEEQVNKFCVLDREMERLMYAAVKKYRLSARSYFKVLKVARTIADLEEMEHIRSENILEALSYREVDSILYNRLADRAPITL